MGLFAHVVTWSLMMTIALRAEAEYEVMLPGTNGCKDGTVDIVTEATCKDSAAALASTDYDDRPLSLGSIPNNCYSYPMPDSSIVRFNSHPVGAAFGDYAQVCEIPSPTTPGSMSGDPIVSVNGLKVKFELPSGQTTLMWADENLEIFSKADVMTPDKQSQWFSDFSLVVNGHHAAHIQRKEIKVAYKDWEGMGAAPHIGPIKGRT